MRILGVLALLAVGIACDRGAKSKEVDCSAAVAALSSPEPSVTLTADELKKLKETLANQCSADKWTDEAVRCLAKATDDKSRHDCTYKHLTQQQQDQLEVARRPLRGDITENALAKMTAFKKSMCACKDAQCAQQVADEMSKWSAEALKSQPEPKMTEEQTQRAADLGEELGGCMQAAMEASRDPAERAETERAMAKMTEFKDQMCACKDSKCAIRVSDDMTRWSQNEAKNSKTPARMTEGDTKKAAAIGEAMGKCMQTAMQR
ncbi:MAG TPA: hypothetical protein VIV11_18835 [Kofleriaceae bacterium]